MSRFNIGDRVRVTATHIGVARGVEFEVTGVMESPGGAAGGDRYYKGDPDGYGVWENYLEPATHQFTLTDFNLNTSDMALAAWEVYDTLPDNYAADAKQAEQDAFTTAFDLGRQVNR
jgi:hypothetical protein